MKKISIIVPIYNTKKEYLSACINSLLKQTLSDIQIILVNDGSDDKTTKLCKEIERQDKRIKLINQKNKGVSNARNTGIKNSEAEWIMFVDADDFIAEAMCEELYLQTDKDVDVIISTCFMSNDEKTIELNNKKINTKKIDKSERKLLIDSIFLDNKTDFKYVDVPWAKLYRREFILNNNIKFKEGLKLWEDGLFNFQVYNLSKGIKFLNKSLYYYRINNESVCNTFRTDLFNNYCLAYYEYIKIIKENKFFYDMQNLYYFTIRQLKNILKREIFNKKNVMREKQKRARFLEIVENEIFKEAFKKIDMSVLGIERKILIILCRNKLYLLTKLLYRLNEINYKNKYILN